MEKYNFTNKEIEDFINDFGKELPLEVDSKIINLINNKIDLKNQKIPERLKRKDGVDINEKQEDEGIRR